MNMKRIFKEHPVSIICSGIFWLIMGLYETIFYEKNMPIIDILFVFSFFGGVGALPIEAYNKYKKEADKDYKFYKSSGIIIIMILLSVLILISTGIERRIMSVFGISGVSYENIYNLESIFLVFFILAAFIIALYFIYKKSNLTFGNYFIQILNGLVTVGFLFFLDLILLFWVLLCIGNDFLVLSVECYFGFTGIIIYPAWLYILSGEKS